MLIQVRFMKAKLNHILYSQFSIIKIGDCKRKNATTTTTFNRPQETTWMSLYPILGYTSKHNKSGKCIPV